MAGAERLLAALPDKLGKNVRVLRAPCMGACDCAPVVEIGHSQIKSATPQVIAAAVDTHGYAEAATPGKDFSAYQSEGGYQLLRSCRAGARTREQMIAAVSDAGLRGLGGAGFRPGTNGAWWRPNRRRA